MTTIAYRDGILAADSWATCHGDASGAMRVLCEKLYRRTVGRGKRRREVLIGTAGESSPALLFVDWYGSGKSPPEVLEHLEADFSALIVEPDGLYEADQYCRPERVLSPFYAIGSGRKHAMTAMRCGRTAAQAVELAALDDPYTGGPVVTMRLQSAAKRRR